MKEGNKELEKQNQEMKIEFAEVKDSLEKKKNNDVKNELGIQT